MSRRLLFYYVIFFLCLWFIVPIFIVHTIPLDSAENIMWGNAPSWGYYKHPPLVAWILHFGMLIFHRPDIATYLPSAISVVVCLLYTYRLSRLFLSTTSAKAAVILTTLIYYYAFPSMQFNQDIILLPLWAMLNFYVYQASCNNQLLTWCKVGVLAGLSLLAKYESVVILTALFCFFVVNPRYHNKAIIRNLVIAMVIMLLIFAPNVYWIFQHDFLPLRYMMDSGDTSGNLLSRRFMNLQAVIITQLAAILLPLLLSWIFSKRQRQTSPKWFSHFLFWGGFGPFVVSTLLVLIMGIQIKGYWAIPYFSLTITALLYFTQRQFTEKSVQTIIWIAVIWNLVLGGTVFSYAYFNKNNLGLNYPAKQIATFTDKLWTKHYSSPLMYIGAYRSDSSNISAYSHFSPKALINFNLQTSPWLSAKKLNKKGGIIIVSGCVKNAPQNIMQLVSKTIRQGCVSFQPITKYHITKTYQRTFFIIPPKINKS